jgi:hypothetical protein
LAEIRLPPTLLKVYEWMRAHACIHWTRREVASALGISYSTARYALEELARRGLITRHIAWPPRRIFYHAYPPLPPALPPPPRPPPREELIGSEEETGYDIWFNLDTRTYMVREPKTYRLIREERKICIELTASMKTEGGHDPITCEITVTTYVSGMGLSDVTRVESEMERGLMDWLLAEGWGMLLHAFEVIGIAYNGEKTVEEARLYTWTVPDYPIAHVFMERKSAYIALRHYEGEYRIA